LANLRKLPILKSSSQTLPIRHIQLRAFHFAYSPLVVLDIRHHEFSGNGEYRTAQ
jgi:hypothetical protein